MATGVAVLTPWFRCPRTEALQTRRELLDRQGLDRYRANLNQMGKALISYTSDYGGYYPNKPADGYSGAYLGGTGAWPVTSWN